jgi:hypothetical protein
MKMKRLCRVEEQGFGFSNARTHRRNGVDGERAASRSATSHIPRQRMNGTFERQIEDLQSRRRNRADCRTSVPGRVLIVLPFFRTRSRTRLVQALAYSISSRLSSRLNLLLLLVVLLMLLTHEPRFLLAAPPPAWRRYH